MPQRSRITSWPFVLLAVALLSVLFLSGGQAATPEKPFADLQEGDSLTAAWLMGTINTIYNWSQVASSTLDTHATNHANHLAATAAHGATGAVVGTTNAQSLTNKTLDSTNSVVGEAVKSGTVADARIASTICRDSELTTHAGTTATHGATGAVVGTTNTQTLTNKTMSTGCAWDGTAIPVAKGGTNATTAAAALTNLGLSATAAELNYVDGVTSPIQTQLNGKQATITGGASTIADGNLIPAKALISDANGKVWSSGVTATELGWLVGVTSGIQAQFSGKAAKVHAHGNITDFGAIGSTAGLPIITTTSGVLTTGSFGTTAGTFCQGNDSRLSDARTPTAHTLVSHTASGLTAGHFLKATGATTFGFAAHGLTYTDVGAAASAHTHNYAGSASAGGAATSALTANGIRTSAPASPVDGDIWVE